MKPFISKRLSARPNPSLEEAGPPCNEENKSTTHTPPKKNTFTIHAGRAISTLFAASILLYTLSQTKIIFTSEHKLLFDISRLFLISFIFFIGIKISKYSPYLILAIIPVVIFSFAAESSFLIQLAASILISWILFKSGYTRAMTHAVTCTLAGIGVTMVAAKLGIIESGIGLNHLAPQSPFIVEEKYDWGFWHFNTITSILVGCIFASLLTKDLARLFVSAILYAIVLTETLSRTFLIVPFILAWYFFFYCFGMQQSRIFIFSIFSIGIIGVAVSLIFLLPYAFKSAVGENIYNSIDTVLSLRLQIAERALGPSSSPNYWIGLSSGQSEVDSLFLSFASATGVIPCLLYLALLFLALIFSALRRRATELAIISTFILTANFEKNAGVSSLIFISSCIAIYSTLQSTTKRT